MRLTGSSLKYFKLIVFYFIILILSSCSRIASTPNPGNINNIERINNRLTQQDEKIEAIEQQLVSYQVIIDNHSRINNEIDQLKQELNNELMTTLEKLNSDSMEQNYLNIINQIQNKIKILQDRTLYTDSLFFDIMNDMVLVENKISSLILSFQEVNNLSVNKSAKLIPKITDVEYRDKYIESLSDYQNSEWNSSLQGFAYLIQVDSKHELADNCQYWIGEVYYALHDYIRSIKEFEKVDSFQGSNKSDDAQFKMGLCYINLDQIDMARNEFEKLIEFYPNSEYYKRAQEYLRQN